MLFMVLLGLLMRLLTVFMILTKKELFEKFKADTFESIENKISLNPILNSFQWVVNTYNIPYELITLFLNSMEMDLTKEIYNKEKYDQYILGSAEVVGLMCLQVFLNGDQKNIQN